MQVPADAPLQPLRNCPTTQAEVLQAEQAEAPEVIPHLVNDDKFNAGGLVDVTDHKCQC